MRDILVGTVDVTVYLHLRFITDNTDATVVSGPITLQYVRTRAAAVTQQASDLGAANAAHTDWGGFHVGNGVWRFDLPDAAVATGVPEVIFTAVHPDVISESLEIPLVAYNPLDSVRLGLTALPNAGAEAAGGLYTRGVGAGQINQDANGRIDTHPVALADNVITAASIQTDAVTEIVAAVWAAAARTLTALDEDDTSIDISDAVQTAAAAALVAFGPPTVAQLNARTLVAASYGTAANQTTINDNVVAVAAAVAALNNLSSAQVATVLATYAATQVADVYAANGVAPTRDQLMMAVHQHLMDFSISGTSQTVRKLNGVATAFVETLDDATSPTSRTRS